jgi:hypothetical protein
MNILFYIFSLLYYICIYVSIVNITLYLRDAATITPVVAAPVVKGYISK